ncbi:MAG: hypothetical protein WBW73_06130 [Rhodoplanes sp.]
MGMASFTSDGHAVTVRVPITIRRRGGRKLVLAPDGTTDTWAAPCRRIDNAMVKAIARAHRWREMLENGAHATIAEIAAAEKINESYVGRILRLTLLAPDIVEAILDGRQQTDMTLTVLMRPFAVEWTEQRKTNSVGKMIVSNPVNLNNCGIAYACIPLPARLTRG